MCVRDCLVGKDPSSAQEAIQSATPRPVATADAGLQSSGIIQLALIAGLCNEAKFDATAIHLPLQDRKINGNATDQAVLGFAESVSPVADMKQNWRTNFRLAFNSKNKFMINVMYPVTAGENTDPVAELALTTKGAPDILLPRCDRYMTSDGQTHDLSKDNQKTIEMVKDKWSSQGKRVILLARKILPYQFSYILNSFARVRASDLGGH